MRKAPALLVSFLLLALALSGCLGLWEERGFSSNEMVVPDHYIVEREEPALPSPLVPMNHLCSYTLAFNVTETIYQTYGGAMELSMTNTGSTTIFVYGFGVTWVNSSVADMRDADVYVLPGETEKLGFLSFGAPSLRLSGVYELHLWICVSNQAGSAWHDYGEVVGAYQSVAITPRVEDRNYTVESNPLSHYDKVNSRVDYETVEEVVSLIVSSVSLNRSVNGIVAAFEWVRENIQYLEDDGSDDWQSANETLEKRTGDCEDQAILLASIYGAMGLNGRVNVIEQHAFASVFVARYPDQLAEIEPVLESIYWTDLHVCYLQDEEGYWLVTDTTGLMYCGGLPALASPVEGEDPDAWTFDETDFLISVDATGETVGSWLW